MKKIKYLAGFLILAALLVTSYWLLVSLAINKDSVVEELLEEVKSITGYKAASDNVTLTIFPTPIISISDFRLDNAPNAATAYFLQAKKIDIHLDLMSVFSSTKNASKIDVISPLVELQTLGKDKSNWRFIDRLSTGTLFAIHVDSLNLINGKVNYSEKMGGAYHEFSKIKVNLSSDSNTGISAKGGFNFAQEKIKIDGKLQLNNYQNSHDFSTQLNLKLSSRGGFVEYQGKVNHDDNGLIVNGKANADFSDAKPLIEYLTNVQKGSFSADAEPFPLKFSVDLENTTGKQHILRNMSAQLSGMNLVGVGTIEQRNRPYLNLKVRGDQLNASQLLSSTKAKGSVENIFWNILTSSIDISLDAELQSIKFSEKLSAQAKFKGVIEDGEMVINQAGLELPGESQFLAFGIIRPEENKKIQFDGWIELIGKRFDIFSKSLGTDKEVSFAEHKGSFKSKANIFLSSGQTIVSGLKFKAGKLYLVGGINMKADAKQTAETSLRISGIKIDSIIDNLLPNAKNIKTTDGVRKSFNDYNRKIPWLDDITKSSVFEVVLDDFTFRNMKGRTSAFKLTIAPKELKADNIKVNLDDISLKGRVNFAQKEGLPKISGQIQLSHFTMPIDEGETLRTYPVPRGNQTTIWSDQPYDFSFLKGYDTDLKIRIGQFNHNEFEIRNLRTSVIGSTGKIKIDKLSGLIWGGKIKASGFLDISSIPIFSVGFSFENIFANKLIKTIASQDNFEGRISFNGQINSLGISPQDWIKSLAGSFLVYGQDIAVKGFNLSGVVKAIPSVRSVSDVINIVRTSLLRRKTSFSVIDAGFYVKDGVLYVSKLKLQSKHAIGTGAGSIDLISWAMNLNTVFQFVTLSNKDMPTLGIHFVDTMDNPIAKLDTRSLEAFVARRKLRR